MLSKWVLGMALALCLGAGLARAQQITITFIKVAEVHRLVAEGKRILLVDVRSHPEYQARHIKGAVSIPLQTVDERYREIPRQELVVLY